ncbi:hypothetical protein BKA67DRAFT_512025 [Truncatella angustata]|uniref:F-box domain-containing protein n=1 Tax=Truncatella angustata TaxID=152316 RepID=A0A9P9A195_9PEZI|nr:uncharacterized protein BKA67DRAFT_512025 [Truncatella angustata]KAH6658098.1 hypothetical protein BKA67DRAFT_512025 [Truncatella angustata]
MALLPDDAYHQIFAILPRQTLASCRLLNKRVGNIATYHAFRHMRLEAALDVHGFVNVAKSDLLRPLVREITVDTWIGPDFKYNSNRKFRPPRDFFRALAYIRRFQGLTALNLRFTKWCGNERNGSIAEETYDFRYLVLDIIFRSLAGNWPQANRPLREEGLVAFDPEDRGSLPPLPTEGILELDNESLEPIDISSLTVSNLADFDDERLTKSESFRQVFLSKSLTSLKLLVATEDSPSSAAARWYPEKYDFCAGLPNTWLSPNIARNLKTLSLYFRDYWGWNPKMDFRAVNPGRSELSGLPNLRVLALGNYVFSHHWQVEWIASFVGQSNGREGLEELYLDDCPIMWQARTVQPLDESSTIYKSQDGETITHSNWGYPLREVMTGGYQEWNPDKFAYHLRWNQVLDYWKTNLNSLKSFRMGHDTIDSPTSTYERARLATICQHRLEDTTFLDYDCPSPSMIPVFGYGPQFGVGLEHKREHILQYVHFDIGSGPTPWIERDNGRDMIRDEGFEVYQAARQRDEKAYHDMMQSVHRRTEMEAFNHE